MSNQPGNKYEDAVFEFFTRPENFETMIRVNEHADRVMKQIVKDFWEALREQLQEGFRHKDKDWVIKYSGDFEERYCKLWIYRESWLTRNDRSRPIMAIAFENLHLGEKPFLGITPDAVSKLYKSDSLRSDIQSLPEIDNYTKNSNKWWACWVYFSLNFGQTSNLSNILPDNRDNYITELTEEAIRLTEILDKEAETIISKALIN